MNLHQFGRRLDLLSEGSVSFDRPLAPFTTYRLGGAAGVLFEPASASDLLAITGALRDLEMDPRDLEIVVVGRGSNMVVSDHGFEGLAVRMGSGSAAIEGGPDSETVTAGAGTSLPLLANWAARRSLSGLEFTVGIPGSVGGGVRMNAGAHEGAIADTLTQVEVYDVGRGEIAARSATDLDLRYRHSALQDGEIVVTATFRLVPDDESAIRARMERYRRHRADTQPGALQNAGSTFKNPPGDSAGRLVEGAGLKGYRVGGAAVSNLHANFFVADEDARSQDVYDLVHDVRRRVAERFGIELEPEVRFVGPFASATDGITTR